MCDILQANQQIKKSGKFFPLKKKFSGIYSGKNNYKLIAQKTKIANISKRVTNNIPLMAIFSSLGSVIFNNFYFALGGTKIKLKSVKQKGK